MDGMSLDIKKEQIEKLKEIFPEVVSEEKIDWERLRATLGEDTFISNERYVLNWAGKSDSFKTLQTGTTATLESVEVCINGDYFPISVTFHQSDVAGEEVVGGEDNKLNPPIRRRSVVEADIII